MTCEDSVLQGSRECRYLEPPKNIIQRLICGNEVDRSIPWVAYGDVLRSVIETSSDLSDCPSTEI